VLDGGLEAWRATGQATTSEVSEADLADALRQPAELGEPDDTLLATYDEVLAWSREASRGSGAPTRLLDVRTAGEWVGAELRARRGGHIPGARHRAVGDLLAPDGAFRSADETVSLVRASGVDPDAIRATYSHRGVAAAVAWFVLHELAGYGDVRPYAGSWADWAEHDDSPIERP
jgi:thiosulfate/3-mercaptopyruvate sulfurtransferase